ncbi:MULTISPECIES: DUF202 domain-containing protein [unclassified Frankia]|uniref:DUF202 domain-containing protein n=1 Tax=unclassified Frankia TaxID=2632575 RepID=UPI000A5371C1|nr:MULTISPECIES: DUF202 domain-containing protein [unclassified Frankia]
MSTNPGDVGPAGSSKRGSAEPSRGDIPTAPDLLAGETQPERTYLAWRRTGLAFLGLAALLMHNPHDYGGGPLGWAAAAAATAGGVTAWLTASRRYHQGMVDPTGRWVHPGRALPLLTLAAVVCGLLALALVAS